jgi:O-antigen ligase
MVASVQALIVRRVSSRPARSRAVIAAAGVAATLVAVSMADGGFFVDEWRWTGLTVLCFVAVSVLVGDRIGMASGELRLLAALAALAVWTFLSAVWSSEPRSSVLEVERDLVYLAGLVGVLLVANAVGVAALAGGLLAGIAIVCAYSLGQWIAAAPSLHRLPLLIGPIGYSNGLGALAAMGIVLAVGLAIAGAPRERAAALSALIVLAPTLVLTESRGAWLALVLGLATTAACLPRRSLLSLWRTALALAGTAAVGLALVWPIAGKGLATLSSADNRWQLWTAAWNDYLAHPLLGSGAGTFGAYWYAHATIPSGALDAHGLYVETLAELGPVGLLLLLAFLAVPLRAAWRRRDALAASLGGALVVYAVHAGIDWDWELPVVTMAGVSVAGLALAHARDGETARELGPSARIVLVLTALGLAAAALVRLHASGRLW